MNHLFPLLRLRLLLWCSPRALLAGARLEQPGAAGARWPVATPPQGRKILKRRFDFAGCGVEMIGRIAWTAPAASAEWHRQLYSFAWLREIAVNPKSREASSFARECVSSFILEAPRDLPLAWDANATGARLAAWLEHMPFLLGGSSVIFRRRFARAVIRHILLLRQTLEQPQAAALETLRGLIYAATLLQDARFLLAEAENALTLFLARTTHMDGSPRDGDPAKHLATLCALVDIQAALPRSSEAIRMEMAMHIRKMGQVLRFFCHGDGRLALFRGGIMGDAGLIARAVALSTAAGEVPAHVEAGFFRLHRKRACVIIQTESGGIRDGYEGQLAFEFSDDADRVVVNCGGYLGADTAWRGAVRSAAAHSTLSIASKKRPGAAEETPETDAKTPPPLEETQSGVIAEASAEGSAPSGELGMLGEQYQHLFVRGISLGHRKEAGLRHKRFLKLARRGDYLAGVDTLTHEQPRADLDITPYLRFHLHPDIRCQKQKDGKIALTTLSGKTWMFTSETPDVPAAIEESVYLGHDGKPQKTVQIVLSFPLKAQATDVAWSFARKPPALSAQEEKGAVAG